MDFSAQQKPRVRKEAETFEIAADDLGMSEAELVPLIRRVFASPSYRPPTLPTVALELMDLANRANVETSQVAALLERDPLLGGRVLRMANSAHYAGQSPILSLRTAVVRLGLGTLRDLVLEAAMSMRVFRAPGYVDAMENLRHHSALVAHLTRLVCRYTSLEAEYAFTCGLFHDIGAAATLLALGDLPPKTAKPSLDLLWPALRDTHEEVAGIVLKLWGMPPAIESVVAAHHHEKIGGYPHPLVASMALAENLLRDSRDEVSVPSTDWDAQPAMSLQQALTTLNLSQSQLGLIQKELPAIAKLAKDMSGH